MLGEIIALLEQAGLARCRQPDCQHRFPTSRRPWCAAAPAPANCVPRPQLDGARCAARQAARQVNGLRWTLWWQCPIMILAPPRSKCCLCQNVISDFCMYATRQPPTRQRRWRDSPWLRLRQFHDVYHNATRMVQGGIANRCPGLCARHCCAGPETGPCPAAVKNNTPSPIQCAACDSQWSALLQKAVRLHGNGRDTIIRFCVHELMCSRAFLSSSCLASNHRNSNVDHPHGVEPPPRFHSSPRRRTRRRARATSTAALLPPPPAFSSQDSQHSNLREGLHSSRVLCGCGCSGWVRDALPAAPSVSRCARTGRLLHAADGSNGPLPRPGALLRPVSGLASAGPPAAGLQPAAAHRRAGPGSLRPSASSVTACCPPAGCSCSWEDGDAAGVRAAGRRAAGARLHP
jgi:hypothetical protein